jgi:probable F420-dependent oxidoreductase
VKFGVNILNFGPGATPENLRRWAEIAEELGYHFIMISDHVANTPEVERLFPAPFYDPFILLAWLCEVTTKVEIGTTVTILPYRHPLLTARMAADVDQLSGGRFIFGAAAGWAQQEFEALGVPFKRRGAIADEYLSVIREFWTQDLISHSGSFVNFKDVATSPRPVRSPHPPIWVGGSSEAAMRRAVRFGDAWHPTRVRLDRLRNQSLPQLKQIAADENLAVPALCPRLKLRVTKAPLDEETRLAGQGTIEQIIGDLEMLEQLGARYVLFDTFDDQPESIGDPEGHWSTLTLIVERVLQRFA